ncbi:retinol dehydrogenase 11-like [Penaeus japonicus]|uniref:retinol dehydrogenase 11-like n=1 Tax=Penaeus japonicus TaxID=27405 RepID=UPI001C715EA4|nr:retinol dehydrogenase 11-like [Penaeus japonicus]XP_042889682.1 retinol dehydrogenase 11-like [Penaeus japonicus]XP_042889683.1 retinol dehydrogenase 11-like [Penaeus japonicus]
MIVTVLNPIVATVCQVFSAGYLLLKSYIHNRWRTPIECHCQNRVRGKVVVITGATSGIGKFTALDLARKGALVYLACRNREAGAKFAKEVTRATGNQDVHFLHLDLTDFSSVVAFVQDFLRCEEKLDVLVNNAAIFHHPPKQTQHNLEIIFQTNYLGVFLLTSLLLDTARRTPNSRIIFVSSESHRLVSVRDVETFDPSEPVRVEKFDDHVRLYGISKLSLRIFAQFVAERFPGIQVTEVNPGNVWTPIYRYAWLSWCDMLTRLLCSQLMRNVQEGAQPLIHALNSASLHSGIYLSDNLEVEEKPSYDPAVTRKLVAASVKLVRRYLEGTPKEISVIFQNED